MDKSNIKAAGIDTGKKGLDVAICGSDACHQFANDEPGHEALVAELVHEGVGRVGIEASGGYERAIIKRLRKQGLDVLHFQPAQVRAYARYRGYRAKNDRIDARLIADCTQASDAVGPMVDPRFEAFREHLTLIEQIEEDLARFKTRLEAVTDTKRRNRLMREINRLKAWRVAELKSLRQALCRHDDLVRRIELIESVAGIGERTALALAVRAPELGTISREQAAALVGVAPYDDDSGKRSGRRHIAGGRSRLRKSLYAASLPAAFKWNPALVALYQRLTAAGKPHKLALTACVRKLVIYVNTVLQRGTPWVKASAS